MRSFIDFSWLWNLSLLWHVDVTDMFLKMFNGDMRVWKAYVLCPQVVSTQGDNLFLMKFYPAHLGYTGDPFDPLSRGKMKSCLMIRHRTMVTFPLLQMSNKDLIFYSLTCCPATSLVLCCNFSSGISPVWLSKYSRYIEGIVLCPLRYLCV